MYNSRRLVTWIIISLCFESCAAYEIQYTDCTQPSLVKQYDLSTVCDKPGAQDLPKQTLTMVQHQKITEIKGWSCSVHTTRHYFKCGVWNHLKMSAPPQIDMNEQVTTQLCKDMITNRKFRPYLSHTDYKISPDQVNIINLLKLVAFLKSMIPSHV